MNNEVQKVIHAEIEHALSIAESLGGKFEHRIVIGYPTMINVPNIVNLISEVGSEIIGRGLDKTKYLRYAEEKGLGTANLDEIEIVGASIEEVYYKF